MKSDAVWRLRWAWGPMSDLEFEVLFNLYDPFPVASL